jgi:DNA polymerase-3 subunit delta'
VISDILFPWQVNQWHQIWQLHQQQHLPHALLFSGISGVGKKQFAHQFAHSLLCLTPQQDGQSCGQCRSCHLLNANSHPDLLLISPEESGLIIKIDQIREAVNFVNETAQQGGYRVIIINPANAMNINAANALLKSLEEPTSDCLFILISHQSKRLLPTIKSRCQEILFAKPEKQIALQWLATQKKMPMDQASLLLKLANDAPLQALELLNTDFLTLRNELYQGLHALSQGKMNPLQLAAQYLEKNILTIFDLLQNWLRDLLRFKLTQGEAELINDDFREWYVYLMQKYSLKNLLRYIDFMQQSHMKILQSANLNRQLLLEEIFILWVQYGAR